MLVSRSSKLPQEKIAKPLIGADGVVLVKEICFLLNNRPLCAS